MLGLGKATKNNSININGKSVKLNNLYNILTKMDFFTSINVDGSIDDETITSLILKDYLTEFLYCEKECKKEFDSYNSDSKSDYIFNCIDDVTNLLSKINKKVLFSEDELNYALIGRLEGIYFAQKGTYDQINKNELYKILSDMHGSILNSISLNLSNLSRLNESGTEAKKIKRLNNRNQMYADIINIAMGDISESITNESIIEKNGDISYDSETIENTIKEIENHNLTNENKKIDNIEEEKKDFHEVTLELESNEKSTFSPLGKMYENNETITPVIEVDKKIECNDSNEIEEEKKANINNTICPGGQKNQEDIIKEELKLLKKDGTKKVLQDIKAFREIKKEEVNRELSKFKDIEKEKIDSELVQYKQLQIENLEDEKNCDERDKYTFDKLKSENEKLKQFAEDTEKEIINYQEAKKIIDNEYEQLNNKNELINKELIEKDNDIKKLENQINSLYPEYIKQQEKEEILTQKIKKLTMEKDYAKEQQILHNTVILPNIKIKSINNYQNEEQIEVKKNNGSFFDTIKKLSILDKNKVKNNLIIETENKTIYGSEKVKVSSMQLFNPINCPFIKGYSVFTDKNNGFYLGYTDDFNGKKYDNSDETLIALKELSVTGLTLLTVKGNNVEDILGRLENPIESLSDFYQFINWFYDFNMASVRLSINGIIEFKNYYNNLVSEIIIKEMTENRRYISALILARELLLSFKLYGSLETENKSDEEKENFECDWLSECVNALLFSDNSDILKEDKKNIINEINSLVDYEVVDDNSKEYYKKAINRINNFSAENEFNINNETFFVNKKQFYSKVVDTSNKENIPLKTVEDFESIIASDFSDIQYIVKKQTKEGLIDISTYAPDNMNTAIGQYCFMESYHREIGIKLNGKQIFLISKSTENDFENSSILKLSNREKHIKKLDKGTIGQLVEFYETKLLKKINDIENNE